MMTTFFFCTGKGDIMAQVFLALGFVVVGNTSLGQGDVCSEGMCEVGTKEVDDASYQIEMLSDDDPHRKWLGDTPCGT